MQVTSLLKKIFENAAGQPMNHAQKETSQADETPAPRPAVVIPLPKRTPRKDHDSSGPPMDDDRVDSDLELAEGGPVIKAPINYPIKFKGLLDSPEIRDFLDQGFFGFGRHNGVRYQTLQTLESGKAALISNFQNVLDSVIARCNAKHDALELKRLDISAVCPDIAAKIDLALGQITREVQILETQKTLAERERGWIAAALKDYEAGFTRGLRDSVDFNRLEI